LAVVNRVQESVKVHPNARILELAHGQMDRITLPLVVKAAQQGDETVLEALHQTGYYLGLGIANLINAFNPESIVLGGGLSPAYPFMLPVAEKVVVEKVIAMPAKSTRIVISAHGQDACVLGAVGYVLHEILTTPNYALVAPDTRQSVPAS
jgi:predicted NBD/HSP70 family sugar kinase